MAAAAGEALGEPVEAGFMARRTTGSAPPLDVPGLSGSLLDLAAYGIERGVAWRTTGLPRDVYLAVTATRVAALEVRFGWAVRVKRVVATWPRPDVRLEGGPLVYGLVVGDQGVAWLETTIPGTERDAVARLAAG